MKFTYKKANGEVSDREVIVLTRPSDSYLTIDITGLTEDAVHDIHSTLDDLKVVREAAFKELGVKYRRFLERNIVELG